MGINLKHPDYLRLRSAIRENPKDFVVITGAGLSVPCGLPSWENLKELVINDARERYSDLPIEEQDAYLKKLERISEIKDLWRCFSELKRLLPRHAYETVIKDSLTIKDKSRIPHNYELFWKIGIKGIITFNLDTCAADSYAKVKQRVADHATATDIARFSQFIAGTQDFVYQPHGIINDPSSWVFTTTERDRLLGNSSYMSFMQSVCQSKHLLILGFDPDDFSFKYIQQKALFASGDTGSKHYIFIANATQELIREMSDKNFVVISYNPKNATHDELDVALKDIVNFFPQDDIPPTVYSGRKVASDELPTVDEMIKMPVDKIRELLNGAISSILPPDENPRKEDIEALTKFYKEKLRAIHMAWLVEPNSECNMIHGYKISERIGRGAFGQVYSAENLLTKETVAVKILLPEVRHNPEYLSGFRRGVRSMRILTERDAYGMVKFKDAFEIPACVIMDYIPGLTLKEAVNSRILESLEQCLDVLVQIGDVVHNAHTLEELVLHRDLKPENVILNNLFSKGDNIDVVVLDFDLSWHKGAIDLSIDRTPGYAAPEQTAAGRKKGVSTRHTALDVFSLGMLAYFLFVKVDPRPNEHLVEGFDETIKKSILKRGIPEWRYLPVYLIETILGCVKDIQEERIPFASAVEAFRLCKDISLTDKVMSSQPLILLEMASILDPQGKFNRKDFDRDITVSSPDGSREVNLYFDNVDENILVKINLSKVRMEYDQRYFTSKIKDAGLKTVARLKSKGKLKNVTSKISTGRLDVNADWYLPPQVALAEIQEVSSIIINAKSAMELQC